MDSTSNRNPEYEIDLRVVFLLLWESKRFLFAAVILGAVFGLYSALKIPPEYKSETTFVNISTDNNQNALSAIQPLQRYLNVGTASDSSLSFETILNSRDINKKVIQELNLLPLLLGENYNYEEVNWNQPSNYIEKLMKAFGKNLKDFEASSEVKEIFMWSIAVNSLKSHVEVIPPSSSAPYTIEVKWNDPILASKIANQFVVELKNYLKDNELSSSQRALNLVEKNLKIVEKDLQIYEEKIKIFNEKYGIFDVNSAVNGIQATIGTIKGQISLTEADQAALLKKYSRDTLNAMQLDVKLNILREQLQKYEFGNKMSENEKLFNNIPLAEMPGLGLVYNRLKRELGIKNELYQSLRKQLESLKIEVSKNSSNIQVIDEAVPSPSPSKGKRESRIIMGALFSFVIACGLVQLKNIVSRRKPD